MLVIWMLALSSARGDVSLSFLIPVGESNYNTSPETEKKAKEIAKRVTNKQNKCFDHLDASYQVLCVNLDVEKRLNLSAATLYCEHQLDQRLDKLPYLDENPDKRNYSSFVRNLDDDTFALFTNLFISIDSICFHATHEAQSNANINTMESIFHASEIAAGYIKDSSSKLDNITREVIRRLNDVHGAMNDTESRISLFQEKIVDTMAKFYKITERARYYRNSVANLKLYLFGIFIGLLMSLILPSVLIPTISITSLFLLLECSTSLPTFTQIICKWAYIFIIAAFHGLALRDFLTRPQLPPPPNPKTHLKISEPIMFSTQN